jgi:hypothetical protein
LNRALNGISKNPLGIYYQIDSLFHTNRQNTSRDVAVRFAEETMLRHLAQDGVWEFEWTAEMWCISVRDFTQNSLYKQHFNGSGRDHADNNFGLRNKFSVGVSALFLYRSVSNNTKADYTDQLIKVAEVHMFISIFSPLSRC